MKLPEDTKDFTEDWQHKMKKRVESLDTVEDALFDDAGSGCAQLKDKGAIEIDGSVQTGEETFILTQPTEKGQRIPHLVKAGDERVRDYLVKYSSDVRIAQLTESPGDITNWLEDVDELRRKLASGRSSILKIDSLGNGVASSVKILKKRR